MKGRKLILPIAALALTLCMGLVACNNGGGNGGNQSSQKLETIKITASKTTILVNEDVQLTSSIEGVTWASDNEQVATVSAAGLVHGIIKGKAKITASKDGYKDGTININVDLPTITISSEGNKHEIVKGDSLTLTASEQGVAWSSTDANIASVENGVVTAANFGTASIKASKDGFNDGVYEIKVVRPAPTKALHMEDADHYTADGVWGTSYSGTLYGPGEESPVYQRSSGNASDGTCIAYMDDGDREILTFTSDADVKAEFVMMMAARSAVSDMGAIMDVTFNDEAIDLAGKSFEGGGDTNTFVEFSFGELNIKNGTNVLDFNFTGSSPYMDDLNIYAESAATITVVPPAAKPDITVDQAKIEIGECEVAQITGTLTDLSFRSNDAAVASVSKDGLVRGVGAGETTISVSKAGYATLKLPVKVNENANAFIVTVDNIQGEGITHRDSQNITGDYKHFIESMDANAVGTIAFTAPSTGAFNLVLRTRASGGYQSTSVDDLATCMTLKINGVKLDLTGEVKGSSFNNYYLGEVQLEKTDCEIEITCLTTVPQINLFRFVPKA